MGYSDLSSLESSIHLPFEVLYQLEVCISRGILTESTLDRSFATRLASFDLGTGIAGATVQLLEHIAGLGKWFPNAHDIFQHRYNVDSFSSKIPAYCVIVQSCTVTPTTIYFNTPTVEVSNRVLRAYSQYARHFLRVKFRDEDHLGQLRASDFMDDQDIFARVKQAMRDGITVGGRTFKFMAYGNSQLREGGAYFFSPVETLSIETLRRRLGTFDNINVVAKYASRMGQALTTTRASWGSIMQIDIPDIRHNGFCFTDGVGKISQLVATMIAEHIKVPSSSTRCPSAFQFRLGGAKGIVVVDPTLSGNAAIYLRPSQRKFLAGSRGLEICRASQYSSAFFNQQLILILDALETTHDSIIQHQRNMIADLQAAMQDSHAAIKLLHKTVDKNLVTLQLAHMIQDGFMQAEDPFFMSCLSLWCSWSMKTLKEKARILIPDGAFLLGAVDETGLLRGYNEKDIRDIPEIFVQISTYDPEGKKQNTKVITGLCIVGRNPSLHPGDVRIVMAVDVPALRHVRNVVLFPQNGDRDIPSMCSGGDLDGDDYFVFWDESIRPRRWDIPPMNYKAPESRICPEPITTNHIIDFFVEYLKDDNLGRIATAHRFLADYMDDGVEHADCLELARLHSVAVDYAKSGVPAKMPARLRTKRWPCWAGKTDKSGEQIYYNQERILHKLYQEVDYADFSSSIHRFDERVLQALPHDEALMAMAKKIKIKYDASIRQLMDKHAVNTEFEVWTGFVLSHNETMNDYNLAEALALAVGAIKQQFRQAILEAVEVREQTQTLEQVASVVVAMYAVTAKEVEEDMASLVSFPWVFQRELGQIACGELKKCEEAVEAVSLKETGDPQSKHVPVAELPSFDKPERVAAAAVPSLDQLSPLTADFSDRTSLTSGETSSGEEVVQTTKAVWYLDSDEVDHYSGRPTIEDILAR